MGPYSCFPLAYDGTKLSEHTYIIVPIPVIEDKVEIYPLNWKIPKEDTVFDIMVKWLTHVKISIQLELGCKSYPHQCTGEPSNLS